MSLETLPEAQASIESVEALEARGLEYVQASTYSTADEAQEALVRFKHSPFARVYDPKTLTVARYEGSGFMVYGKKIVRSAFDRGRRGRRSA